MVAVGAAVGEFERIVRMWRLAAAEFGTMETVVAAAAAVE